jgi:5-hydroxyisourate hydrolase
MISTHVQDAAAGIPARRVPVDLDFLIQGQGWREIGHGLTNADGHIHEFGEAAVAGIYRLSYDVASYLPDAFFPSITLTFEVTDATERCHLLLVLSPFAYSTCRTNGE